jgi:hypothetical protein
MRIPPILLLLSFALVGCQNITEDPFTVSRNESATLNTVYGEITVDLLFQDETIQTSAIDARVIARLALYTAKAWEERFGTVYVDTLRHITVIIIRNNSSQWQDICWDQPNDPMRTFGCSNYTPLLLPELPGRFHPGLWEIAIETRTYYNSNYGHAYEPEGVIVHEMLHGMVPWNLNQDDINHTTPGVWEGEPGSVVYRAVEMYRASRNPVLSGI